MVPMAIGLVVGLLLRLAASAHAAHISPDATDLRSSLLDEPVPISRILNDPAVYDRQVVLLRGTVRRIHVTVPRPANPMAAVPPDFYEPWCRSRVPMLTFVVDDLVERLDVSVASRLPCGSRQPVYPPATELSGITEGDEVFAEVEIRVRWQTLGARTVQTIEGLLHSIARVHD